MLVRVNTSRRALLAASILVPSLRFASAAPPSLRVTGFELIPVRATQRTVWLFVRLRTDAGLTGLGEASDAFSFLKTTKQEAQRMEAELRRNFELVQGKSPLDVEAFRRKAEPVAASGGLIAATAYSAVEQALWDLAGQALETPVYNLFGGKLRDRLPVYANINRATTPRTPAGFADTARRAVKEGFRSVKAAPFDGFPKAAGEVGAHVDQGIACVAAIREAVGPAVDVMIDCHSNFDVPLSQSVARRLEQYNLAWYEEPVAPGRIEETVEIRRLIRQPMAGGEVLFGTKGFAALCRRKAVNVIMPDVKHCGGLLEMAQIAALARMEGVAVAPHNPSGPVSTAASVQACAAMPNFQILELQWGEVDWRGDLVSPVERFDQGQIAVSGLPGFGIRLNDKLAGAHPV